MTRRRIQQTAADPTNHFSKWLGYRDIFNWNKCAAPFGCLSCPYVWRVALGHGVESSSRERTSISTRNPLCSSSTDSTTQSVPLSLCCSPSISFPVQDNPARLSQSELWVVRNLSWEIRIVFFAVHSLRVLVQYPQIQEYMWTLLQLAGMSVLLCLATKILQLTSWSLAVVLCRKSQLGHNNFLLWLG